jgi:hypothetical protein
MLFAILLAFVKWLEHNKALLRCCLIRKTLEVPCRSNAQIALPIPCQFIFTTILILFSVTT